jgi:hypothetical protein
MLLFDGEECAEQMMTKQQGPERNLMMSSCWAEHVVRVWGIKCTEGFSRTIRMEGTASS